MGVTRASFVRSNIKATYSNPSTYNAQLLDFKWRIVPSVFRVIFLLEVGCLWAEFGEYLGSKGLWEIWTFDGGGFDNDDARRLSFYSLSLSLSLSSPIQFYARLFPLAPIPSSHGSQSVHHIYYTYPID